MRSFFRTHWKVIVAIVLLILLALATANPSAAVHAPSLAARLRSHVDAIAPREHRAATRQAVELQAVEQRALEQQALEQAAGYIENVLASEGYRVRRQAGAGAQAPAYLEVAVANVAAGARPARLFVIGAHYRVAADDDLDDDASARGSGTAAVLELARLLKDLRPSAGTEVRFVFSADRARDGDDDGAGYGDGAGDTGGGNFIAFAGTLAASRLVQDALSAFQATDRPARGLAAPAYVQGLTLLDHGPGRRAGAPAVMITDTAFLRYPYYRTQGTTPDPLDDEGMARVVAGLARTLRALAAGAQT